jgi:hypothetical protein
MPKEAFPISRFFCLKISKKRFAKSFAFRIEVDPLAGRAHDLIGPADILGEAIQLLIGRLRGGIGKGELMTPIR